MSSEKQCGNVHGSGDTCVLEAGHRFEHQAGDGGIPWTDKPEQLWMDAARSALWTWESYREARNPLEAASKLVDLNNQLFDLATWLPEFDDRIGWLARDEDDQ